VKPQPSHIGRKQFWTLTVAILGSTIAFVDGSVVNVALPAMSAELGANATTVQWIVNGYQLPLAALLLVGGAASDQLGRRLVFISGLVIFTIASILCGLSQSPSQLIAARVVQGIGAAFLIPSSLALIGAVFDEDERGKAIGTWAAFSAISGAAGPILGGWIVDHTTWHWIFLINPLLALPTLWLALRNVSESHNTDPGSSLDWRGAVLAFGGLGCVVFALISSPDLGWLNPVILGAMICGGLLLVAFIWNEAHSHNPMMPLELFRLRAFSGINLLTLFLYAALGGAIFFLPFDLIQVHGYSATQAGAVFLPFTLIMGLLSRWSGGLVAALGARVPLIVGPTLAGVSFGLLAAVRADGSYWTTFLLPVGLLGLGMAIAVAPLTTVVINAVPAHRIGAASGINNAVAGLARLLAVAAFGAIGLAVYNHAIDDRVEKENLSPAVMQAIAGARDSFVVSSWPEDLDTASRQVAEGIYTDALSEGIRVVMGLAAGLALAGAVCGAVAAPPRTRLRPTITSRGALPSPSLRSRRCDRFSPSSGRCRRARLAGSACDARRRRT
jgi:EmrB/QacA subfamily drug resistance transporter